VLFVLVVVWATDIGGYFGGRTIGGPKLWPRVSPKKTWSGAVAGVAAACAAGGLTVALTGVGNPVRGFLLAIPLSMVSQAGDLAESAVKRRFGVKDSGHIIPGHGGVLDRVDGLFAAATLAWLIAALGMGGEILGTARNVVALSGGAS
jgi:phosphatidate cytidylyltransferase